MECSKEYIDICKKLPRREQKDFINGDWVFVNDEPHLITRPIIGDTIGIECWGDYDYVYKDGIWIDEEDKEVELFWLPHSVQQWMDLMNWKFEEMPIRLCFEDGLYFIEDVSHKRISENKDSLLACAKAWLKSVEE